MKFLRYPGGKGKQLNFLVDYLPCSNDIKGKYIEPFVGGGSVFLFIKPRTATIADLNPELIYLYKGIKLYPHKVWETFASFPEGKISYYKVRDENTNKRPLYFKAARTLYLNRTCFKGMWRHNPQGNFNVGYGGEDRRWVITHQNLIELSKIFRNAEILSCDFEKTLKTARNDDFIFLDPPYKPGEKDLKEAHYINGHFSFDDQKRLFTNLDWIKKNSNIKWAMTNSSHLDILKLYSAYNIRAIPYGTGERPGIYMNNSNEVLITNY